MDKLSGAAERKLLEIMYQDFVAAPPQEPKSMLFVLGEPLARRICGRLNAGVDRESGPGGKYFYTEPAVPFFGNIEEYEKWIKEGYDAQ